MTTAIVHFHTAEGQAENFANALTGALEFTRTQPGCQGATMHINEDNPNHIIAIEQWDSSDDHKAYVKGLEESGELAKMASMLDSFESQYFS